MGRPPIGTRAMTGAQRQRRYSSKRTGPTATPVATTTASVVELAQLEKLQRDTQDEVPLPGGVGVNVKCLRLYPVEVFRGYRDQHGAEALRAIRDAADQVLGEANRPGTRGGSSVGPVSRPGVGQGPIGRTLSRVQARASLLRAGCRIGSVCQRNRGKVKLPHPVIAPVPPT
jgi:hypothetical protein